MPGILKPKGRLYYETVGANMGFIGEVLGWTDLFPRQRLVVVVRSASLLVTISGLLVLAWIIPTWQTGSVIPATQIESVKTMAQIILGALVFGTLWVAWQRAKAADRTADAAQRTAEASQQTVRVAQEGQNTERFTKAVEQLGNSESMTIRLGGIYALERTAQDSERDHWQVNVGTNLSISNLKCANLQNANLSYAILGGADLCYANFQGSNLENADLRYAGLRYAIGLTLKQVCSARTDGTTELPDYLTEGQNL